MLQIVVLSKFVTDTLCLSTPHSMALASLILTKFLASAIDSLVGSVFYLLSASATIFVEPFVYISSGPYFSSIKCQLITRSVLKLV